MLGTSYLDDSADPECAIVFVAAGFWCPDAEWKRLRREWRKILRPYGIRYYRTYDWRTLTGDFARLPDKWGDRARQVADKLRVQLETVLESSPVLAGFGLGINMQDFREVDAMPEAQASRQWMRESHDFQTAAFRNVFCRITQTIGIDLGDDNYVDFICDDSNHYRKIRRGYERVKEKFPYLGDRMLSLARKNDKLVPELQMADLMADVARATITKSIRSGGAETAPDRIERCVLRLDTWNKNGMLQVLRGETPGA